MLDLTVVTVLVRIKLSAIRCRGLIFHLKNSAKENNSSKRSSLTDPVRTHTVIIRE